MFQPAWVDNYGPNFRVKQLIHAIHRAEQEGLRPEDYHLDQISKIIPEEKFFKWRRLSHNPRQLVDLELLLSDAFLLYGSHLFSGRINSETIDPEWFAGRRRAALKKPGASAASPKQILLLEDISFFRHLIRTYLEADGYKVITAENGQAGLERINASRFDLIVSDLEMPVMNGWEFLEYVRKGRHQSDIPAMALTALDSPEDRKRALACGFDRYEVKLDRERFLTSVAELLGLAEKQEVHS